MEVGAAVVVGGVMVHTLLKICWAPMKGNPPNTTPAVAPGTGAVGVSDAEVVVGGGLEVLAGSSARFTRCTTLLKQPASLSSCPSVRILPWKSSRCLSTGISMSPAIMCFSCPTVVSSVTSK